MKLVSTHFVHRLSQALLLTLIVGSTSSASALASLTSVAPASALSTEDEIENTKEHEIASRPRNKQIEPNNPSEPPTDSPIAAPAIEDARIVVLRAFYNLLTTQKHSLDSRLSVSGSSPEFSFQTEAQIQTIIEQPNRFRAFIQVNRVSILFGGVELPSENDNQPSKYVVTSDGETVWIFDTIQNIYAVMTYREFMDDYEDNFFIGFLSNPTLGLAEDTDTKFLTDITAEELFQDEALLQEFATDLEIDDITLSTETVDGRQYVSMTYNDVEDDSIGTFLINPETFLIDELQLTGPIDQGEFVMQEEIVHSPPPAAISEETFTFTPPNDAQLSETPIPLITFF